MSEQNRLLRMDADPEYAARRREQCRLATRKLHVRTRYGLTLEDLDALREAQGYCCLLCGRHESELVRSLHVDHNHASGEVRGLLCFACNTGIGKLGDAPVLLRRAADYLERT